MWFIYTRVHNVNSQPPEFEKDSLTVERVRIEKATRDQSKSAERHMVRSRRITGSTCEKNLKQKEPTPSLLQCNLHPKHLQIFHLQSNGE